MSKRKRPQNARKNNDDDFLSEDRSGPSIRAHALSQGSISSTRVSSLSQEAGPNIRTRALSQGSDPNTCASTSSQRYTRNSNIRQSQSRNSQNVISLDMMVQEEMQLISNVIRYLFMMECQSKLPIQKTHIVKNILDGNNKQFNLIIDGVRKKLSEVFGYKLVEIENKRYILVNEIENHLPHLLYNNINEQILLFLVLVHLFMLGEPCTEEMLWKYLRKLGIITDNSFQHKYFGDVKQLVTVDFINQRYLAKAMVDKSDPSKLQYIWGSRAENEITFRSCLEFIAKIYDCSPNNWKLQYKTMIQQEKLLKQ